MTLINTTSASEEPVSLTELKTHLRISDSAEDTDLTLKLKAAREYIEGETHRALVTSTWKLCLAAWPNGFIELPLGNLQSATITYRCSDGTVKTLDAANYKLVRAYTPADADTEPPVTGDGESDAGIGRIYPAYGLTWPTETLDVGEPIEVTFACGWDGAENVPAALKAAILLYAGLLYRDREPSTYDAMAIEALCSRYADKRF